MNKYITFPLIILAIILNACSHSGTKNAIKVMTLNIRYDNPEDSLNAWPNRIGLFCRLMSDEKPDILGMQEVLWRQYTTIDSVLKEYNSVGVGRDDGARGGAQRCVPLGGLRRRPLRANNPPCAF